MDNNPGRRKIQVTRVVSGVKLLDERKQAIVSSSKSRCFLCFGPEGRQFLLNEAELTQNCTYYDGTKIRPASIDSKKVTTVYSVPTMDVLAAAQ
jgi:hypothetical protein